MLFNSYVFVFAFLPITVALFVVLRNVAGHRTAIAWLVAASFVYYAWWSPPFIFLLVSSIVANFVIGRVIQNNQNEGHDRRAGWLLGFGVAANLAAIGYFKYAGFLESNIDAAFGFKFGIGNVVLPIGISFFTFQQIAYLVDIRQGKSAEQDFLYFALFVSFFPQLIAGPIVHHNEFLPQLFKKSAMRLRTENIAVGATIFSLGLFKKVVIADQVALYASPVFAQAASGGSVDFVSAWIAALAYSFQIYFDFSGYSDMAIGLARLFGIVLPANFLSPYKATNIIEFWRRWHITLSRFLRDYLYIPLGGNRRGRTRRYVNVIVTMLLGGLWHGASWNFVIWGGLHGVYLMLNHFWRWIFPGFDSLPCAREFGGAITFLSVTVAWLFFRADSLDAAFVMIDAMFPISHGFGANLGGAPFNGFELAIRLMVLAALLLVVTMAPNVLEFTASYQPALLDGPRFFDRSAVRSGWNIRWRLTPTWAVVVAVVFGITLLHLSNVSEFIYYRF